MNLRIYRLVEMRGELGEVSFGMLKLGELWNLQVRLVR